MAVFRRISILAALAALTVALTGCERTITRVEVVQEPQTCFTCHSDQNTILVDAEQQWENSQHSTGTTLNENDSTCKGCHTSEGFIARATGTTPPDVIDNPTAIHCFTCHAPHSSGDFGLRWTTPPPLANAATYNLNSGNICVACHQARRNVTTYITNPITMSTRFGPHYGTQGDMLIGSNGYEYAGYTYQRSTHREATTADGKDGCLECHYKATSQYVVGGHTFNMKGEVVPPLLTDPEEVLNVAACAPCHGPLTSFDYGSVQTDIDALLTTLNSRLVTAGLVDASTGGARAVKTSRDSAGAVWNYLTAKYDRSKGVHNPEYIRGLLESSIAYISGSPAPVAAHWRLRKD